MAVIISQSQNEIADMHKRGLEIAKHRQRMVHDDLEEFFKDPDNPLRIVFVCAMWTTGFDVPSCSTIYLDMPMKNHSLMQTIARANRVFPEKTNGLIVDYVGVFRNLQQALAIYAMPSVDDDGSMPVKDKAALIEWLRSALAEADTFCAGLGINLGALEDATGNSFEFIKLAEDAVEEILRDDDTKNTFMAHAQVVDRLFKAILPDRDAAEFAGRRKIMVFLADTIKSKTPPADVAHVLDQIEALLDESVAATPYVIPAQDGDRGISEEGGAYMQLSTSARSTGKRWPSVSKPASAAPRPTASAPW